jgi:NDP-sugar pyrophosphorylase family protein
MSSTLDISLYSIYQTMTGLLGITSVNGNTLLNNNITCGGNFYVSNNSFFNNNVTVNSTLNVSGYSIFYGNNTITSNLNIIGNATCVNTSINSTLDVFGNSNVINNLYVNNDTIINNLVSINSNLNVSGNTFIYGNTIVNNINGLNNNPLNINAPTINIGNVNSHVTINGTVTYIATTNLQIIDKIILLNVNQNTLTANDIGNYAGINILGTSGNGYLRTTVDASRYELQPPLGAYGYVLTVDNNNNLNISNNSLLNNNVTISSNLNVSGNSYIINNTTILSNLNIINNAIFNNLSSNSILNVLGNSTFINNITINSLLTVSGNTIINNNVTINSSLIVSGNTIINNNTTINSNLNVSGNTIINNNTTIMSTLTVSNNILFNNNLTINSSLNVNGNTIFNNTVSINSSLNVSGNCFINNNITVGSGLNVNGNTIIQSQVTIASNLNMLGGIIASLPQYSDNGTAKTGNVPIWGWYRTGGIIKIRLNDVPPIIYFSSSTIININSGTNLIDPGAYALDYQNNYNNVYLTLLVIENTNINLNNILITGTSTLITTNNLSIGSYTATYIATDSIGNIGINYRTLNITA